MSNTGKQTKTRGTRGPVLTVRTKSLEGRLGFAQKPAKKPGAPGFAKFVANEPATGQRVIDRLRQGYPATLVKQASRYFDVPEKHVIEVVGLSSTTAHRLARDNKPLDAAVSERFHRIAVITRQANAVFDNEDQAKAWLLRPNLTLGNSAPLDLLDTEVGADAVRRVLHAVAEGGVV